MCECMFMYCLCIMCYKVIIEMQNKSSVAMHTDCF